MWELHAVVIDKTMYGKDDAEKMAKEIIKIPSRRFMRETSDSYRFRNIPKTRFSKFRSKIVKDGVDLVFGELKPTSDNKKV